VQSSSISGDKVYTRYKRQYEERKNGKIINKRTNSSSLGPTHRISNRVKQSSYKNSKSQSSTRNGKINARNQNKYQGRRNPLQKVIMRSLRRIELIPLFISKLLGVYTISHIGITIGLYLLTEGLLVLGVEVLF
jgi:hypothetical protein